MARVDDKLVESAEIGLSIQGHIVPVKNGTNFRKFDQCDKGCGRILAVIIYSSADVIGGTAMAPKDRNDMELANARRSKLDSPSRPKLGTLGTSNVSKS